MKVVKLKLSELKRPERNTRMHTDKQIAEFKRSVEMFGQIRPIVVDENYTMLAGNGLYDTLLAMGRTEADCYIVSGLSDKEKKKLMLADNRIFDLGVDDMDAFDAILAELGDDLDVPGYDDDLLRTLVADTDDVDEMMAGYGLITEDQREAIRSTPVRTPAPEQPQSVSPETAPAAAPEHTEERRCVVCPNCGETVWL